MTSKRIIQDYGYSLRQRIILGEMHQEFENKNVLTVLRNIGEFF